MGNEQQREGQWQQIKGTLKENVGDLTGNEQMEREGQADQAMGNVREGIGNVREGVERTGEHMRESIDEEADRND
jgi:uncharacterized protein YjbJ (UPF0337 family)